VAVSLLSVVCAALLGWQYYAASHFSTSVGEIRRITLADGSGVTLDTGTRIQVAYSKEGRVVKLTHGVALFDVAHDASRPFVVEAGSLRVRAVGTAFIVRHLDETDTDVTVTRGLVDVWQETAVPEPSVQMKAGLRASATRHEVSAPRALTDQQIVQATAWQDGFIDLDGRTLAEAAQEFNRYNELKILIDDPALAREEVVGRFSVSDPQGFTNAAAAMLNARVSQNGRELKLERRAR
jgi:transmembrane sensor